MENTLSAFNYRWKHAFPQNFQLTRRLFSKGHYLLWFPAFNALSCLPRNVLPTSASHKDRPYLRPRVDRRLKRVERGREKETKRGKRRKKKTGGGRRETGFLWRVSCKQSSRHRLITNGGRGARGDRLITRLRLYVFQRWSNATDSLCAGMASNPKDRVVHVVKTTSRRISRGSIEVCTWKARGDDGVFLGAKILKGSRKCYHFTATAV